MSNYTKTVNFAAKDSLASGDAAKIVKGTEIDTEFNNIATASATKADAAGAALTGTTTFETISDGTISITAFVDEDNMASNSATLLPTQQSVKAYVDASSGVADGSITTAKLADDAVTAAKLASSAVVTASIVDDNVTQAKIADDAVGADQLAASAVVTASIVDDNVTQAKIADDAVGADQLAASAVVTASIVDDAVTSAKLANSITMTGALAAAQVDGGVTTTVVSSNATATTGQNHFISSACTLTLPASPSLGDRVMVAVGNFATAILGRNSEKIEGTAEDMTIDVARVGLTCVYTGSTYGWAIY
tara:strand:- start:226 stop:1146 length:921 start_codon:yes stop_codon:yes gene_type:complete